MAETAKSEGDVVSAQEKPRGRTRFCKTCKFSSTDGKEFQHHQMYAHNAEENRALDKEIQAQKLEPRRKSLTSTSRSPRRSRDDPGEGVQRKSPSIEQKQSSDQTEKANNGVTGDDEQVKLSDMEIPEVKKGPVKRTGNIQTRNYVCVKCAFDTTSAKVFLHHQVDEHQENISIFECDLCDYATKYKQKLPRHRKLHFTAREGGDIIDGDLSAISLTSDLDGTEEGADSIDGGPITADENCDMTNGLIELGFEDLANSEKMDESDGTEVVNSEVEEEMAEPESEAVIIGAPTKTPTLPAGDSTVPRKKAPRQEVDPRKYVVIHSDKGVKYACSRCTSVYSWRKSLNKHWKEKHPGDLPDARVKAKKMAELNDNDSFNSSTDQSATAFRGHHGYGNFGPPLTSSPVLNVPRSRSSTPLSSSGMSVNIANYAHSGTSFKSSESYNAPPMPNVIGPFVTNSIRPTYVHESNGEEEPSASDIMYRMNPEVLDLSRSAKQEPEDEEDMMDMEDEDLQDEPLDFSFKPVIETMPRLKPRPCGTSSVRALLENGKLEGHYLYDKVHVKTEPLWSGDENENFQSDNFNIETKTPVSPQKSPRNHVLQCSRCAYVAKTLVDYSSHMGIHLNKRAFKCAECQEHFGGVDELNEHFADKHSDKILKHKEAIQKIPHGLLQTYHLLNMPVNKLSTLSSNSFTTTGDKQLKCNMCGFLARWPAELQKHAVSHSEERPFVCMVCGSTYKWKWDLVKHFEKSHHTLPNPYKRRDPGSQQSSSSSFSTSTAAALIDDDRSLPIDRREESTMEEDEGPSKKRRRLSDSDLAQLIASSNNNSTIANPDSNNNEDNGEPTDDTKLLSKDYEAEYLAALEMRRVVPADREPQLEMTDAQALKLIERRRDLDEMEFDPEDPEPYMQNCRPINEMTQKIIAETLRQRISMGKLSPNQDCQTPGGDLPSSSADILLPYKCPSCEYRARWPSEITQHMKNHSDEKPFRCPRCSYKSKWKWDVVKHLKRCGGGTIKDVIDTSTEETDPSETNGGNVLLTVPNVDGQSNSQPVTYLVGPFSTPPAVQQGQQVALLPTSSFQGGRITVQGPCPNVTVLPPNSSGMVGIPSAGPMNSPESALSPNSAVKSASQQVKQPIFHGIINDGMYHCLHCPFVGHSPAELKRHSIIHSEDRPFTCSTCGYSSKWKGDLKKHLRTYSHAGIIQGPPTNRPILPRPVDVSTTSLSPPPLLGLGEVEEPKPAEDGSSLLFLEKVLFKCNRCPYVTYKQSSYDAHVKVHGPTGSIEGPSKFKCKQCQFQAHDLSTFLQHRVTHTQAAQMTVPTKQPVAVNQMHDREVSSRTIHLKYRRKPIKQFRCFKCPYVCFKRSGLDLHIAMHEPRGVDACKCLFCDYNVYSRSLLLQHMRLHSEYDPAIHSDSVEARSSDFEEMQQQEAHEQMDGVIDLTTNTSFSHVPALIPKPSPAVLAGKRKALACEWCSATFDHLSNLYQHAQRAHSKELAAQEMTEKGPIDFSQTSNPMDFIQKARATADFSQKPKPGVSLLTGAIQNNYLSAARNFTTPKNYPPIMPKTNASTPNHIDESKQAWLINARRNAASAANAKSPVAARKSTSPAKRSPRHQCTKCPFIASNLFSYYRHMERHGSNCKHTCPYCDYSINRLNLLYQHMKGAHNIHWYSGEGRNMLAEMKQMPRDRTPTPTDSSRTSTPTIDRVSTSTESTLAPKDLEMSHNSIGLDQTSFGADGADDLSPDFMEKYSIQAAESRRRLAMASSRHPGGKPTLVIVEETNWRGIPIQICFLDGRKNYKCPICNYISNNAANATNHVRQHGTNRKYRCDYCNYSVDNLRLVYHHMESIHRNCPYNTVERIEKTSSGGGLDLQLDDEASSPTAEEMVNNVLDNKVVSQLESALRQTPTPTRVPRDDPPRRSIKCSHCPFRAKNKDSYTKHLEMHEYSGRYRCKKCSYSADRLNLMTQHSRVHSPPVEADESLSMTQEYRTPQALRPTAGQLLANSSSMLAKHKTVNMNSRINGRIRYRCSRCPFKTFCKSNIIKHRRQHLIMGKYKCQKCNYSAMRWYVLQQHMKFHEAEVPESDQKDSYQDFVLDPDDEAAAEALRQAEPGTLPNTESLDGLNELDDEEMEDMDEPNDFDSEQDMKGLDNENFDDIERDETYGDDAQTKQCEECPFNAKSSTDIRKHSRLHQLALKFRCDLCSYSIDRLIGITEHRKLHAEEPGFHADVPADSLNNPDYVEKSGTPDAESGMDKLMVRSGSMSEESMRFTCSMCPHQCNSVKNLNVHMAMHGKNDKFICDYCSWSADRLNLLYQHRKLHCKEPDYDHNPEDIKFLNREYTLGSVVSPALEQSEESNGETGQEEEGTEDEARVELVRSNSGPASPSDLGEQNRFKRLYNCNLCPFSCNNKSSFAYHKNLHHIRAKYTCTHCSYSVARWNLLRQHMRLHEETKEYVKDQKRLRCPTCPYHTRSKALLDTHIVMHTSGKKYSCDFCEYSIDQSNLLQQHLKVHSTITLEAKDSPEFRNSEFKVFEPPESGTSRSLLYFNGPKNATDDDSMEAEFKCDRCPFSTAAKEAFEAHEQRHNVRDMMECPYCDYSCPDLDELLVHVRLHFPSTQMDKTTLQTLMAKNGKKKKTDNTVTKMSSLEASTDSAAMAVDKGATDEAVDETMDGEDGQNEPEASDAEKPAAADDSSKPEQPKTTPRTKVYVCQYCEREFEDKVLMRQHESQHLIGSQY